MGATDVAEGSIDLAACARLLDRQQPPLIFGRQLTGCRPSDLAAAGDKGGGLVAGAMPEVSVPGALGHQDLDEGVLHLERAIGLNPNDIGTHWQLTGIAHIRMAQGRYEEALEVASRSLAVNSGYDATFWMLIEGMRMAGMPET